MRPLILQTVLFRDLPAPLHLELVEATTYATGLAIHVYRPSSS
jgi:hypothetical protein